MTTTPHDKALEAFTEYFVKNYPGPDTIIFDPKWHAPKLFHAAMKAIEAAGGVVCQREPAAWAHRLNLELDQFLTEFTGEPEHPFGEPGVDFSAEFTVNSTPLHAPLPIAGKGDEEELWWQDKIEGLEADLESAVEVAYRRGATDWVRLNYPTHYARLSSAPPSRSEEGSDKI